MYVLLLTFSFNILGREVRRRGSHPRRPGLQPTDRHRRGTMARPPEHHGRSQEKGPRRWHLEHVSA
jgi:hypothetical protein